MASREGRVIEKLWVVTPEMARQIRKQYRSGWTYRQLAESHVVAYGTIQRVIAGRHGALGGIRPNIARARGARKGSFRGK